MGDSIDAVTIGRQMSHRETAMTGERRRFSRGVLALTAACALVSPNAWAQAPSPASSASEVTTWKVEGDTREAIVYARAASRAGGRVPLVFSFHGRGDDAQSFQYTNLHVAWPDAVVVYFQGLEARGGLAGWQVERGEANDRDLKLVDAALASLRQRYNVDEDRIYATGFSNGASFTYLLWAERPGVFAAYAAVAGRLRPSVQPKQPRPLFHIAGLRDQQVTFPDQKAAIVTAVAVNGVRDKTTRCGDGCTMYGSGTSAPVMTWIHQGGHDYPRGTSERIASFFRDHPRTR
jgi:polyhydroxybutyrate depolymerase